MTPPVAPVSVIIPAFRNAATISGTLESIAVQTVLPREIVVVDDGSDDGTFDAAQAAQARIRGISLKIYRRENKGPGAARNLALKNSSCEIIGFLDADDEWLPTKLERSLAVMRDTRSDIVSHDYIAVTANGEHPIDCVRHFRNYPSPLVGQFMRGYISSTTVVARRDAVFAVGGFDPTLPAGQDYELWLALLAQPGLRFFMFAEALSRYRLGTSGITGRIEQRRQCAMRILDRYAPLIARCEGGGRMSVALRAAIISYQAGRAYVQRGDWSAAAKTLLNLPRALYFAHVACGQKLALRSDYLSQA